MVWKALQVFIGLICSFAKKRDCSFERWTFWCQISKCLASHFNMEKTFLLTRLLSFYQWFVLAKCFDLSMRSEISSHIFSFIDTHLCFIFFFGFLLFFYTKQAIMICLMPMRCLGFGGEGFSLFQVEFYLRGTSKMSCVLFHSTVISNISTLAKSNKNYY